MNEQWIYLFNEEKTIVGIYRDELQLRNSYNTYNVYFFTNGKIEMYDKSMDSQDRLTPENKKKYYREYTYEYRDGSIIIVK